MNEMHSERKEETCEVILGYLSENSLCHSVPTRRRTKVRTESKPFYLSLCPIHQTENT